MKLTTLEKTGTTLSNREFKSKEFGIGNASVVIEILRNRLYSHPIRTLVQEYICNGRDATREAGHGHPLTISVPNALSPVFKVRDYGVGISPERMENIFVMYGSSTKRDSNNQTGGFGIGAKSAWAYTDSFNIVSYVNGTARYYVAHIGKNNNGTLELFKTEKTDEPNGTEIQIAVKREDVTKFREAIERATFFWSVKPEFKGVTKGEIRHVSDIGEVFELDGLKIIAKKDIPDHIFGGYNYTYGTQLLIDEIPYVLNENHNTEMLDNWINGHHYSLVCIGNGVVEVSASREAVADSTHTKTALKKLVELNAKNVATHVKDHLKSNSKDIATRLQAIAELSERFSLGHEDLQYKGYKLMPNGNLGGNGIIHSDALHNVDMFDITFSPTGLKREPKTKTNKWGNTTIGDSVEINQYKERRLFYIDKSESIPEQNKRLRFYGQAIRLFQIKPGKLKEFKKLKDDLNIRKLSELPMPTKEEWKAIVGPRAVSPKKPKNVITAYVYRKDSSRLYTAMYEVDKWARRSLNLDLTDLEGADYIYVSENTKIEKEVLTELTGFFNMERHKQLILISDSNLKKVKGIKGLTSLEDYLKAFTYKTNETKSLIKQVFHNFDYLGNLKTKVSLIDDPDLKIAIENVSFSEEKRLDIPEYLIKNIENVEVETSKTVLKTIDKLIKERYPLLQELRHVSNSNTKELVFYINAKFEQGE